MLSGDGALACAASGAIAARPGAAATGAIAARKRSDGLETPWKSGGLPSVSLDRSLDFVARVGAVLTASP